MRIGLTIPCSVLMALALAACHAGWPGNRDDLTVDVVSLSPVGSKLFIPPSARGADVVALFVAVKPDQLRPVLESGGNIDFLVADCANPQAPGERVALFFGNRPIDRIEARNIPDDDSDVMLVAAVPGAVAKRTNQCGHIAGHPGSGTAHVTGRAVALATALGPAE